MVAANQKAQNKFMLAGTFVKALSVGSTQHLCNFLNRRLDAVICSSCVIRILSHSPSLCSQIFIFTSNLQ